MFNTDNTTILTDEIVAKLDTNGAAYKLLHFINTNDLKELKEFEIITKAGFATATYFRAKKVLVQHGLWTI